MRIGIVQMLRLLAVRIFVKFLGLVPVRVLVQLVAMLGRVPWRCSPVSGPGVHVVVVCSSLGSVLVPKVVIVICDARFWIARCS